LDKKWNTLLLLDLNVKLGERLRCQVKKLNLHFAPTVLRSLLFFGSESLHSLLQTYRSYRNF